MAKVTLLPTPPLTDPIWWEGATSFSPPRRIVTPEPPAEVDEPDGDAEAEDLARLTPR